ncbi:MAG: hypothetical protein AB1664_12700, partial [Thermodesulfobacteriota bacterium]
MDLMKRLGICIILAFLVLGANPDAGFSAQRAELENRLEECARALKDMLDAPDGGIPADLLRRSRA